MTCIVGVRFEFVGEEGVGGSFEVVRRLGVGHRISAGVGIADSAQVDLGEGGVQGADIGW